MRSVYLKLFKLVRARGLATIGAVGLVVYVYFHFFFDNQVKAWIESSLTETNGAKINIGSLESSFFSGKLRFTNVQIGNPFIPLRNIFEIENISVQVGIAPLLRKKLVIEDMRIEGIHYGTARENPGSLPFDPELSIIPPTLMDRAASGVYAGIRNELFDNPLRHLGQLATGKNIRYTLESLQDQLQSVQHLKHLRSKLAAREPYWDRQVADLPSTPVINSLRDRLALGTAHRGPASVEGTAKEDLAHRMSVVEKTLSEIDQEIADTKEELAKADDLIAEDVTYIRRQLGLPRTDFDDLTELTFGPHWLSMLERLSYWLDLSRTEMPAGRREGEYTVTLVDRGEDQTVHFGKPGALPSFLLHKATFVSGKTQGSTEIKMEGTLVDLASDPIVLGRPAVLQVKADFPEKKFRNMDLMIEIDHSREIPKERVALNIEGFNLTEWPITSTDDIQVKLSRALASLKFDGEFKGDQVNLTWASQVSNAEYEATSRFRQVEQTLRTLLSDVYTFDLSGNLSGMVNDLKFEAASGLGKTLASGLKREFKHQFGAIDETITTETRDLLPPLKEGIKEYLRHYTDQTRPRVAKALSNLQNLTDPKKESKEPKKSETVSFRR